MYQGLVLGGNECTATDHRDWKVNQYRGLNRRMRGNIPGVWALCKNERQSGGNFHPFPLGVMNYRYRLSSVKGDSARKSDCMSAVLHGHNVVLQGALLLRWLLGGKLGSQFLLNQFWVIFSLGGKYTVRITLSSILHKQKYYSDFNNERKGKLIKSIFVFFSFEMKTFSFMMEFIIVINTNCLENSSWEDSDKKYTLPRGINGICYGCLSTTELIYEWSLPYQDWFALAIKSSALQ